MNDDTRKFLTGFLGEIWYEEPEGHSKECRCGECLDYKQCNRTFSTRTDMMDLYGKLHERHEWSKFRQYAHLCYDIESACGDYEEFTASLFCLNGKGYEARCQMVADYLRRTK